ncbi:MAG: HepT-like ribonuclease domain-containing protein [Roseiarcus sp.]
MTEKKALRVQDYIEHMLRAIERIESYVHDLDHAAFERNTLVQDAVIRNFEIIGEAANKIQLADSTFAQRHPELRLDLAYRMRNALIHGYDSVNLSTIWNTIQSDLPTLRRQLANV